MKEIDNKNSQIANMRALQNSGLSLVSHQEMKKLVNEKGSFVKVHFILESRHLCLLFCSKSLSEQLQAKFELKLRS